ncbi:hypothetical protein V5799_008425 [Amblyomma americanum]|uniref:Uncharacterized protein n=1 Tax=Amblyomma americanum TaxID=6943 RepID=A0AAQ4FDG0_AMBAM
MRKPHGHRLVHAPGSIVKKTTGICASCMVIAWWTRSRNNVHICQRGRKRCGLRGLRESFSDLFLNDVPQIRSYVW